MAPGRVVARMAVTDSMINGHGIVHGGYVFLLADTAFAFACNTYDQATVAAGCDVVFVAPARAGDVLRATATEWCGEAVQPKACSYSGRRPLGKRSTEKARAGRSGVYDVTPVRWSPSCAGAAVPSKAR